MMKMIDKKFIICTECLKKGKCRSKAKRFSSVKNLNIHLARKHETKYKVKVEKSTIKISRLKRPKFTGDLILY